MKAPTGGHIVGDDVMEHNHYGDCAVSKVTDQNDRP
jgi:hypothetical protein